MKKKLFVFAFLAMMVSFICSCSVNKEQPKNFYAKYEEKKVYTKVEELDVEGSYLSQSGYLLNVQGKGKDETYVYNLKTKRIINTSQDSTDIRLVTINSSGENFCFFAQITENIIALFNDNGVEVGRENTTNLKSGWDLINLGKDYYRVDTKGNIKKIASSNGLSLFDVTKITHMTKDYYYASFGDRIEVYNKKLEKVNVIDIPSYYTIGNQYVLENGDIFMSLATEVTALDSYDIIANGKYYLVNTYICNPKTGHKKEIKMDKIIANIDTPASTPSFYNNYGKSVKNVVYYYEKDGKYVNYNIMYTGVMTNGGKISATFGNLNTPIPVADGYYVASEYLGNGSYLLDNSGKIISEANNVQAYVEDYMVGIDAIYGYDLKEIQKLEDNFTYYGKTNHMAFFKDKENNIYAYTTAGAKIFIAKDTESVSIRNEYYVVRSNDSTPYRYYNSKGFLLTSSKVVFSQIRTLDNAILFTYTGNSQVTKYCIFE